MKKKIEKIIKDKNIQNIPKKNDIKSIINIDPSNIKKMKNDNQFKMIDIKKSNDNTLSKTERENLNFNNTNNDNDNNYSSFIDNIEEDEFNSDENISSTMLEVETNTYIDEIEKKSNVSALDLVDTKIKEKSPSKINNNKLNNNCSKSISINNEEYVYYHKKSGSLHSNCKKNKNYFSSSPKSNKSNDKNKNKIFHITQNNQNINTKNDEKKKLKIKKYFKNENTEKEKDKNYSMIGKEFPLKLENINNNFVNLVKKKNYNLVKYALKKVKLDINNINNNLKINNKTCKHKRAPTMVNNTSINKNINNNNKNHNTKELVIKQKYKKINNKFNKKNIISPISKKMGINSMKILNSINNINHMDTPSSLALNANKHNRIIYYNTNNNLIKNNKTIAINNNNTINLNNNKNFNKKII